MDAPANPATLATLKRRALSLGAANAFDFSMQFLLPIVLVRCLTTESFGQYRLLWLAVTTVMVTVPLQLPQTLYFFLPRADAAGKRLHVHQTLLYMAVTSVLGGVAIGPWNPLLPAGFSALAGYGALVPAVAALLAVTVLLDMLPTIEERVRLQARLTVVLSLLRTLGLAGAAWLTGDLHAMIWLLLALLTFKLLLLLGYVAATHGLGRPWFEREAFRRQFTHAAPFGIASAFVGLREPADQWVAASLFALSNFAAFSVGTVLGPMVTLVRQAFNNAFLPTMSRLHAAGDLAGMVEINGRANVMVATLVYPLLAFAFVFADEIVTLVYTQAYVAAVPVMRVHICGMAIYVVELSSVMLLMRQGPFVLRLNLAVLAVSVATSWFAARHFGLAGAACGGALAFYIDRYATLRRIAAATGLPLHRLQNWPALGRLLLSAALAGAVAWMVIGYFPGAGVLWRLLAGGMVVAAAYGALWALGEMLGRRPLLAPGINIGKE